VLEAASRALEYDGHAPVPPQAPEPLAIDAVDDPLVRPVKPNTQTASKRQARYLQSPPVEDPALQPEDDAGNVPMMFYRGNGIRTRTSTVCVEHDMMTFGRAVERSAREKGDAIKPWRDVKARTRLARVHGDAISSATKQEYTNRRIALRFE
jgi:hypothetical protein